MQPPSPLLRHKPAVSKNNFGHVLVIAGSASMLGAPTLVAIAAMRSGAGLATCAIPEKLNLTLQKKLSAVVMTMPLPTRGAAQLLLKAIPKFDSIAIGPGLGRALNVSRLVSKIVAASTKPLVIDADALNALSLNLKYLKMNKGVKIITPHSGEMARLIGKSREYVEKNRKTVALEFARDYNCFVLLKGNNSIVASPSGDLYVNKTGNAGMATAGSGDVLTGVIAALLAQGVAPFESACFGCYWHGKAGDLAARKKPKATMIAIDIEENLPQALRL